MNHEPIMSILRRRPPALMFGVPVDDLTMAETLDLIEALVADGRATGASHQIATVNVDFLVNAMCDESTRAILQGADVCIPDGMPVVWGAGPLGMPLRERIAGADLVPLLIEASRTTGLHVHVFGSTPAVADAARTLLNDRYPGARFSIDPGPIIRDVDDVDDAVLDAIAAVDADILCVALGNPKQERFIHAHRARLRTPVMIGVGGSLDMLVGKYRRAPAWAQRMGLEWIVRAAQEPQRLGRRYAHDIRVIVPAYAQQWRATRRRRRGAGLMLDMTGARVNARVGGRRIPTQQQWEAAAGAVAGGAEVVVAATSVNKMSDPALAQLVGLVRVARRSGASVRWESLGPVLDGGYVGLGVTSTMLGFPPEWRNGHHP